LEKQAIGRAQRPGRTSQLKIWKLYHNNELSLGASLGAVNHAEGFLRRCKRLLETLTVIYCVHTTTVQKLIINYIINFANYKYFFGRRNPSA